MKTYKTIQSERVVTDKIICNKCGEEILLDALNFPLIAYESFEIVWGYGSKNDFETWKFELCEKCLLSFIDTFKLIPNKIGESTCL